MSHFSLHIEEFFFTSWHITLSLASFIPCAFMSCFIFTSCLSLSFVLIPFTTWSTCVIHCSYATQKSTKFSQQDTDTQMKSSRTFLWVHVPFPRQALHGHTAGVQLMDFWHRLEERGAQNPSQGADACFLLTYAPEMEQGEREMERKPGDIRSERRKGRVLFKEELWKEIG